MRSSSKDVRGFVLLPEAKENYLCGSRSQTLGRTQPADEESAKWFGNENTCHDLFKSFQSGTRVLPYLMVLRRTVPYPRAVILLVLDVKKESQTSLTNCRVSSVG